MAHTLAPRFRRPQEGVVLIIALVLMLAIGVTTTMTLKFVMSSDQIGSSIRDGQLASQAAEATLRWCEDQVIRNQPGVQVLPPPPGQSGMDLNAEDTTETWRAEANWVLNTNAFEPPAGVLAAIDGGNAVARNFNQLPQCMAQQIRLRSIDSDVGNATNAIVRVVRVTVRGFSPNYDRTPGAAQGGEVWLQSTLYIPF